MGRFSFVADEHVPRVFVTVLRSKGFDVATVRDRHGTGSDDAEILSDSGDEDSVVITNDRDFVRLATRTDHAGIVVYTDRTLLLDDPAAAAEAVAIIDRQYSRDEMRNRIVWLDNWV